MGHGTHTSIILIQCTMCINEDVNKRLWDYGEGSRLILLEKNQGRLHRRVDI